MVKSIFDLEKRTDLETEVARLDSYLQQEVFIFYRGQYRGTFYNMVDSCFELWPYRHTAISMKQYFELLELPTNTESYSDEECMYYLQFIFDYIHWLYLKYREEFGNYKLKNRYFFDMCKRNSQYFATIQNNINIIAEMCNYKLELINSHMTFIKRDADVDSILKQLESEDDLRLALLSYNDFRIENNVEEKRMILKKIGDWLEPKRSTYRQFNSNLTTDIFFLLNNAHIRHNNSNQLSLNSSEMLSIYDGLFKMMLHLIRTEDIKNIQNNISKYKP